ncbi:MAG: GNAT family acetyltransferase [Pseudomonadota bacterium]
MNELLVRAFEDNDRKSVIALWRNCGLVVPQNSPDADIDNKLRVDRDLFLVALDNEGLVATVMGGYEGHRGWVNYLAVDREKRGLGYGKRIMAAVEALLKRKGCPKINLQVRSSNAEVVAFYRTLGYTMDDVVSLGKRLDTAHRDIKAVN